MPMSLKKPSQQLIFAGLIVVLALAGFIRWCSTDFDRPFEEDEWLTVSSYTWAETETSGESRNLNHIEDYYSLPPPTAQQFALGMYFAVGRWPEPNNHIVNSVLVNVSQLISRSERWVRLPALVGGMVFVGSLFWLCGPILGWWSAAPLVLVLAWFWPYTVHFSETARGYSWSLALQVLLLIAANSCARRPTSLLLNVLCATLAALTFLNLVNLALDWLFPAYLVFFLLRPELSAGDPRSDRVGPGEAEKLSVSVPVPWRKVVLAQGLAVMAIGLTFLTAHLPAVVSSSRLYGEQFTTFGEFIRLIMSTWTYLFPGSEGTVLGLCGVFGVVLLIVSRNRRSLGWLCVAVVLVSLTHFLLTKRLPYPRGTGYWLPLVMLGMAFLLEQGLRLVRADRVRAGAWVALTAAVIWLSRPGATLSPDDPAFVRFLARLNESPVSPNGWTIRIWTNGIDVAGDLYRPRDWNSPKRWEPGHQAQVCFLFRNESKEANTISVIRRGRTESWRPFVGDHEMTEGPYRLIQLNGTTRALQEGPLERALVLWYPDPEQLGIDARQQIHIADDSGLEYLRFRSRYRVKMDLYGRLLAIAFIVNSPLEYEACLRSVEDGKQRYGGSSVVFPVH